jgi:hypothetical protein
MSTLARPLGASGCLHQIEYLDPQYRSRDFSNSPLAVVDLPCFQLRILNVDDLTKTWGRSQSPA